MGRCFIWSVTAHGSDCSHVPGSRARVTRSFSRSRAHGGCEQLSRQNVRCGIAAPSLKYNRFRLKHRSWKQIKHSCENYTLTLLFSLYPLNVSVSVHTESDFTCQDIYGDEVVWKVWMLSFPQTWEVISWVCLRLIVILFNAKLNKHDFSLNRSVILPL